MELSVIIPAYNEVHTIKEILRKVKQIKISKEILVIDDGSTDGTREYLMNSKDSQIKTIFHEKNRGKSSAVRTGIREAKGKITIIQDADLEYDPQDYYKLIEPIMQGKYKVVYGTRYPVISRMFNLTHRFFLANRILTIMSNILYNANITDEPTCYKVFDTKVLQSLNLKSKRFEFCPEVTAKIRKKGYRIYEVPISYNPRTIKEGKKINWKDGVEAIWTLIKYRFVD